MRHGWMYISKHDLEIEQLQIADEGKELSAAMKKELTSLKRSNLQREGNQKRAVEFLNATAKLKPRKGYRFQEPSDLDGIIKNRPKALQLKKKKIGKAAMTDKFLGAWLGRCAGCLLGKPVEGWRSYTIKGYLEDTGRFPLSNYFSGKARKEIVEKYKIDPNRAFIENVSQMVEDDDTNYTIIGLTILKNHSRDFQPVNVADSWMSLLPILRTCTAERAAYRNMVMGFDPPESAHRANPYREWIGAQIRADFFGYAAVGNPELAAEFAWRDASISHIKNGIYGEMWVAAMLAVAPFCKNTNEVITHGLAQIPEHCRLTDRVKEVQSWYSDGVTYEDAVAKIAGEWDEHSAHHWCHTISNAMLVVVGLLWGELDFQSSICKAVQPGFDTDCNGATVGSIVGMMFGGKNLPSKWIEPLNDRLFTGVHGYADVRISDLARETYEIAREMDK